MCGTSKESAGTTISIHAPHARSDLAAEVVNLCGQISIHAPHARSDEHIDPSGFDTFQFQSTLLMRGATSRNCSGVVALTNFNPRSSCEERP